MQLEPMQSRQVQLRSRPIQCIYSDLVVARAGRVARRGCPRPACAPQKLDSARPELVTPLLAGCGIIAA